MCTVARHYWGLIFTFLQTPSSLRHSVPWPSKHRASGNSHLFVGPPNHPVDHEMSSFHHSEMQMTDATIISHPVIISYAFWKGRKCVVLSLSLYCLLFQRMMTSTQMHEKVRQHKHILYSVLPRWLYKDFHFVIIGTCIMATLHLFHSFPLFYCKPFHVISSFLCHFICKNLNDLPALIV